MLAGPLKKCFSENVGKINWKCHLLQSPFGLFQSISPRVHLEGSQKLFKFSPFLGIIERSKS